MSTISARTYDQCVATTLSDTVNDPAGPFAGFIVTVTGDVKFNDMGGNATLLTAVAANTIINIATQRIFSTGTSATVRGLVAAPYKKPISS